MSGTDKPQSKPDAAQQGVVAGDVSTIAKPDDHGHVAQDARAGKYSGKLPPEHGGQAGPEPTRFGDWERKGRCTDF